MPTLESLTVIESLDRSVGSASSPELPVERGTAARLVEALAQLESWAIGVRMAYETLGEINAE